MIVAYSVEGRLRNFVEKAKPVQLPISLPRHENGGWWIRLGNLTFFQRL